MDPMLERIFLDYSVSKLNESAERIAVCLDMLSEEQVWARGGSNENAIGNLVLHLSGNVRQWIVASIGKRPDIRNRAQEFAAQGGVTVAELRAGLLAVVADAAGIVGQLTPEKMLETVTIQDYDGTVMEAIYHVVEHFSMHTGQILFATKLMTGADLGFYRHLSAQGGPAARA